MEDDNDHMDSECRDTIEPYLLCEEGFNAHDEELYQVENDRDVEQLDTLPDTDTLLEKILQLYSEDTVIHHQEKEPVNVVIKNDKGNEDKCVKCRRKVLNGIRCTICKKAWHWKCGGVTKESTTAAIIRDQNKECQLCRSTEKNCMSCKIYSKEITRLKKNIIELEDNLKNLNQELKICSERAEDLEDRLCREKKLRKQVERDLNELKEQVESDSTSSSDESCHTNEEETDHDTRKSRTKAKRPTSRSLQSERSKARARGKSETSKKSESDSSKRQPVMETWHNGPAEIAQNNHHAENEDALTSPKKSRGRQHSQHSQHLQNAINYLQKYVHSTGTDGDNVGLETIDEDTGPGNTIKQPKGRPILNKILADKKYCHEFQRTGACAKIGCRFMHIDPQKAYRSPITHNKKSNNKSEHRPKQNDRNKSPHKDRELSYSDNTKSKRTFKKSCFKFNNYGYCKFGDKCRYIHFEQSHNNQQHNQQIRSFLTEMRALVGSVKDMIESQKHVGLPVAFTGFPSQAQQPYQHVGHGHMAFPGSVQH